MTKANPNRKTTWSGQRFLQTLTGYSTSVGVRAVARRILDKIGELRENPHRFVPKLANSPYYPPRVGATGSSWTSKKTSSGSWS